ncbi:MAG: aminotransferase class I/II-fold pyridoxal phosphate-dependent enzyme [Saprospiraceae bacterium]|nr:aminotransferase class I/II-fold pyridoxal phosphate-dependent enzyme [Saprospiraceae bacterium]
MIGEAQRLHVAETYYFAKKLAEIREMNANSEIKVLNLGIGSPDLPPPAQVIDALAKSAAQADAHGYQSYKGIPELTKAFGNWYKRHFDVDLNADQEILPLIGSKEGVMHISMSYLNPGDEVLVPNPGYPAYAMCAKLAGAEVKYFDLEADLGWLPDLNKLENQDLSKVKIMWVNYPNMPTGGRATKSFFEQLIAFGKKHDILICHDNPYTFILNDDPISLLQIDGAKETAVELVSLSKNYNMAGWRIGAVCGSKQCMDTILKFKSNMDSGMFKPMQVAAVVALSLGSEWFDYLNGEYHKRKIIAIEIMKAIGCEPLLDGVGMFVWAKIPDDVKSAEEMADEILYKNRVFITPGHIFGSNGDRYLRISLCSDEVGLNAALHRITHSTVSI